MVIPCLYSFLLTVLRTLAVGFPVNKKRTRTLSHRESGSYDLGRHSYRSRNRGLSDCPLDRSLTLPTGVVRAALFESCTVLLGHETVADATKKPLTFVRGFRLVEHSPQHSNPKPLHGRLFWNRP